MLNPDTVSRDHQRKTALQVANNKRSAAAQLKVRLRQRTVTLAEVLERPPAAAASQMTWEVLSWAPGVGPARLKMLNVRAVRTGNVNLAVPLGSLTDRQRRWLTHQLAARP